MADGNRFNGSFTRIPSVQIAVNTTGLQAPQIGTLTAALIGIANGGQPGTVLTLASPDDARKTLRGGDLLTAVLRHFSPSNDSNFGGPSQVYVIRVNNATTSTGNLTHSSTNEILVTSRNWGALDNNIYVIIAAGTTSGKKVTVGYNGTTPAIPSVSYTQDNIARTAFTIQYTGAGSAASLAVTGTTLTTTCTGATGDNLNITLASYSSTQALVNYITTAFPGKYTVTVGPYPTDTTQLDAQTIADIATTAEPVTNTGYGILVYLNSGAQNLVTAAIAGTWDGNVPDNQSLQLSGAIENGSTHLDGTTNSGHTVTATNDWLPAFNTSKQIAFNILVPISGDTSSGGVLALATAHIKATAANILTLRRGIFGAAASQTENTLTTNVTYANSINYDRVYFVCEGFTDIDDITGVQTTYPSYINAAMVAGIQCGLASLSNSITYTTIRANGLEWYPTVSDIEVMLANGIIPIQWVANTSAARVVRGISTWIQDNNFYRVELTTGIVVDQVVQNKLVALQPFIGSPVTLLTPYQLASRVDSDLANDESIGLISDWGNIVVQVSGDAAAIKFGCSPIIPLNFIDVTINANITSGSATVTVGQ